MRFPVEANMAFHFTLETILRYRRRLEDHEQLRLKAVLLRRAAILQQQEHLRQARSELQTKLQHVLSQDGLAAAELQFCLIRSRDMQLSEERLNLPLHELQSEIVAQTARYQVERQRREVLESLRDVQLRNYETARARREQSMLDELHLLRRHRKL
jgi:flagellar export protein FliJ